MSGLIFLAAAAAFIAPSLPPQSDAEAARAAIDAGNQAWVEGVKAGDVKRIIATYAEEAVDCSTSCECTRGRLEIERQMATQLANLGPAHSASVTTWGSVERGNFVYEWGRAEAAFEGGKTLVEKYLTAWQRQPNGAWKIFRNMVIPE